MNASPNQAREMMWLQEINVFCQKQGWALLEAGNPPRLLVQWPLDGKPMLVQVAPHAGWGVMFLVPLGEVPEGIRLATLLATGALNYRLPVACLELEPISGEARARITLTPEGELSEALLTHAFQALEEAIGALAIAVEAFCALQKAAEALENPHRLQEAEAMMAVWADRSATD